MTKDAVRNKTICKKSNISASMDLEGYIKNQQNLICQLEADLKEAISKGQLLDFEVAEKNKLINELEKSIKQKEEEVHKIKASSEEMKEENKNILIEFNCFKEKFFQLETDYDKSLQELKETNFQLIEDLQKQNAEKDLKIQTVSLNFSELQQKFQNNHQEFEKLKELHMQTVNNLETIKKEIDQLKEELIRKDDLIKQSTLDKDLLEKEKNLIIDELNNKIHRIERAFSQPTKIVQPMASVNQSDGIKNNASCEKLNENVNVILPQVQKSLNNSPFNNFDDKENKKPVNNLPQRNYKFKRPILTASPQQSNHSTNRKRRNQPIRQSTIANYNLSSSSASEDEDSNFNDSCLQYHWRPNKPNDECYVADTDTSEGFAKSKRFKK